MFDADPYPMHTDAPSPVPGGRRPIDHVYVLDAAGFVVSASDGLRDLLGYRPEELIGRHYLDLVAPADRATSERQFLRKARDAEQSTEELTELLGADGRRVLLAIKSFRLPQPPDGLLVVGAAVRVDEPPLVELASGDAAIGIGDDFRVVGWNEAAERLTGRSAGEALGKPCWEVLSVADESGVPICGRACRLAERATGGGVARMPVRLATAQGERRLTLSTLAARVGSSRLVVHLLPTGTRDGSAGTILTGRQHEILALLAEGCTTAEIARRLVLSKTTVRNHVQAILGALHCHSRLEAVAEGRRLGLV